jgi:hypothetical protein
MSIDTLLGIVGSILGITGLIAGYIFYRKSLRIKEPFVSFKSYNLIRDYISKFDDLKILYKGRKIQNLTVTKILIWNNGSDTITREDITTIDPFRVVCVGDAKILDAKVLASNNPANQFSCALSDNMTI